MYQNLVKILVKESLLSQTLKPQKSQVIQEDIRFVSTYTNFKNGQN